MAQTEISSPVPGTFYRRPDPDSAPFKAEGDEVAEGETLGLVEIMKNFQEIVAESSGTFVEYLVANEEAIVAGQEVLIVATEEPEG